MPAKKREPSFDPEQVQLETAYTEHLITHINKSSTPKQLPANPEDKTPIFINSSQEYPQPQSLPAQTYAPIPQPAPEYQSAPYPTTTVEHSSVQYSEPQREAPVYSEPHSIPTKTKQDGVSKKVSSIIYKRLDVCLGVSLGLGFLSKVFLNLFALGYLHWLVVIAIVGIALALIYFSKDPKSLRPFIFMAACFLIGFILGGFGG
jgi:hypothetical protein